MMLRAAGTRQLVNLVASTSQATPCVCQASLDPLRWQKAGFATTTIARQLKRPGWQPTLQAISPEELPKNKYTIAKGQMMQGIITKAGVMDKTVTMTVQKSRLDRKTQTLWPDHRKYLVHDADNGSVVGDVVQVQECRPVSRRKKFQIVKIVKPAKDRGFTKQLEQEIAQESTNPAVKAAVAKQQAA